MYKIRTNNKYVLKAIYCNNISDFNTFKNELVVGSIYGIEAVGPRIYPFLYDTKNEKKNFGKKLKKSVGPKN